MKSICVVFLFLLLIGVVVATPTLKFQHNQTRAGETIFATLTSVGEFVKSIKSSDITFYEGRLEVPFPSDIAFYNGTYYIYVYVTRVGNFSIHISNVLYRDSDGLKSVTIVKKFNVTSGKITDEKTNKTFKEILSIRPGFVFSMTAPTIKLINIGDVVLNLTYGKNETSLEPMESKEIILSPPVGFSYFNISSYEDFSVPIIYLGAEKNTTNKSVVVRPGLKQSPKLLFAELFTDNETKKTIQLFNFGDENVTDVSAKTDIHFVKINGLGNIAGRGVRNISVIFNAKTPGHFKGNINITYTQYGVKHLLLIPMSLFVLPKGNISGNFTASAKTCKEMSGVVCKDGEICDAGATFTRGGEYCCLGTCQPDETKSKSGGYGWLVGIFILLAIGGAGYYLYRKQKKIVPKKPDEQMKELSEKFGKRMAGNSGKRISGGLSKS